jgi:Uncharacterized protein conserved in bacteria
MIIDTSAAIAVMRHEPEAEEFLKTIAAASHVRISAASVLEMAIVSRADPGLAEDFVADMGFEVLDINAEHLYEAIRAQERFGRGSGSPAKLNLGDCFSYAAAKVTGEPLLFKGDDFTHTDIHSVLS